jgi:hypothetical protein
MSKNDVSLPANRAFVLQLQANSGVPESAHRGRIEHLGSGRATRFLNAKELWAFVDSVLATEYSGQRKPEK